MTGLFDQPPTAVRHLSRMYSSPEYQAGGQAPRWTQLRNVVPVTCDECFAEQIETRGAAGPRAVAKARRTVRHTKLNLCRAHEELWKIRDLDQ